MWNRIVSGEKKNPLSNQTPEVSSVGRGTFLPSQTAVSPLTSSAFECCCSGAALPFASRLWDPASPGLALGTRLPRSLPPGHAAPRRPARTPRVGERRGQSITRVKGP